MGIEVVISSLFFFFSISFFLFAKVRFDIVSTCGFSLRYRIISLDNLSIKGLVQMCVPSWNLKYKSVDTSFKKTTLLNYVQII